MEKTNCNEEGWWSKLFPSEHQKREARLRRAAQVFIGEYLREPEQGFIHNHEWRRNKFDGVPISDFRITVQAIEPTTPTHKGGVE